ncbi:YbaB/EbfC family nucleoid-associated protein [Nocardia sp. NPDC001965]
MDRGNRETLLSADNGLRGQVERLLDTYEREHDRMAETYRQVEALRMQACSPDRAVEVTVDSGGVLTELKLTAAALRRSPEALARSIVDTVQAAVRDLREEHRSLIEAATAESPDLADQPDIMPGTPGLDGIRAYLRGDQSRAD